MIDYNETIKKAQRWGQRFDPECVSDDGQTLDNLIALLQHYREGLEKIADARTLRKVGQTDADAHEEVARKTLEGPSDGD